MNIKCPYYKWVTLSGCASWTVSEGLPWKRKRFRSQGRRRLHPSINESSLFTFSVKLLHTEYWLYSYGVDYGNNSGCLLEKCLFVYLLIQGRARNVLLLIYIDLGSIVTSGKWSKRVTSKHDSCPSWPFHAIDVAVHYQEKDIHWCFSRKWVDKYIIDVPIWAGQGEISWAVPIYQTHVHPICYIFCLFL